MEKKPRIKPKPVDEKLDIEPAEFVIPKMTIVSKNIREDIKHDYGYIRERLLNAINKADVLLDQCVANSPSDIGPRTIEASSTILKTICDASQQLLNLHKEMISVKKELGDFEREVATNSEAIGTDGKPIEKKISANINDIVSAVRVSKTEDKKVA